jgi:hypothetical protein
MKRAMLKKMDVAGFIRKHLPGSNTDAEKTKELWQTFNDIISFCYDVSEYSDAKVDAFEANMTRFNQLYRHLYIKAALTTCTPII